MPHPFLHLSVPVSVTLSLASSALLVLSFPNPDHGWLAWIALVPLILACSGSGLTGAFLLGLLCGAVSITGIFYWIFEVSGFRFYHMLTGSFYFALYPALWSLGYALFQRVRLPFIVIGPALWVSLDYVKSHAGFLAFPWAGLAHTQHKNLAVLQVASLTGEAGITFLLVMAGVAIAGVMVRRNWRNFIVVAVIIVAVHLWGAGELSRVASTPSLRVAAIQPAILNSETETDVGRETTLARLEGLTKVAAGKRPELIAWPETAVRDISGDPLLARRLQNITDDLRIPLIIGASEYTKFVIPEEAVSFRTGSYNSAYYFIPDEPMSVPYRKMILVPFGEYIPYKDSISWPRWFVPKTFNTIAGADRNHFELECKQRFAALICWENLFAGFVRSSVRDGAGLLVHLTNDNWFGPTAAPRQHNVASVLRAVENRIPVVIASNTGPSQIIDHRGRVRASVPEVFRSGVVVAEVQPRTGLTFYSRFGDLFSYGCLVFVFLVMGAVIFKKMNFQ